MGIRSRVSRVNRSKQKARARAKRRSLMALARPRCPECDAVLVQDATMPDLWDCSGCGVSLLKLGSEWLTQIEAPILSLPDMSQVEGLRKVA
jgi:ribosomal protein L37AE/L43A